ncbi:LemA family protein [Hirschia litorea]|uniref:LemA family protein n=1 Tax=Hirschia litorea TaxID=1199156 RepID=A0ABW2II78_9PROT
MVALYVVLGLVALIVLYLIALYNGLVAKRQQVNESFSGIDVQLKLRQNLVPNLVDTVKGYAAHERDTLEEVIQARNSAMAANGPADSAAAEGMLSAALGKLFALSEAYPDLKANTNFLQLQNELSQIEDKIAASRRFYNSAVGDFNTAIEQFPAVMLASGWGFTQREFFDLGEEDRATMSVVPEVKF